MVVVVHNSANSSLGIMNRVRGRGVMMRGFFHRVRGRTGTQKSDLSMQGLLVNWSVAGKEMGLYHQ